MVVTSLSPRKATPRDRPSLKYVSVPWMPSNSSPTFVSTFSVKRFVKCKPMPLCHSKPLCDKPQPCSSSPNMFVKFSACRRQRLVPMPNIILKCRTKISIYSIDDWSTISASVNKSDIPRSEHTMWHINLPKKSAIIQTACTTDAGRSFAPIRMEKCCENRINTNKL